MFRAGDKGISDRLPPEDGHDSVGERLQREGQLLLSIPGYLGHGVIDRLNEAADHKLVTGLEVASSIGVAAALTILSRNPGTVGTLAAFAPKIFGGFAVADGLRRFGGPMMD